jgi:hypothetical protein
MTHHKSERVGGRFTAPPALLALLTEASLDALAALAIDRAGFPVPSVGVGDFVKLIFLSGRDREHMWVRVTSTGAGNGPHVGILSNEPKVPSLRRSLQYGQPITFSSDNVEVRVRAGDFMKGAQFGLKMG